MSTVELTEETFASTIESSPIVLLDFWAAWCGPCRMFAPVFEKVSDEHPDVVFGKVNTEEQQQLAGAFGVSSIPTLVAIRDGVVLFSQPGALPEPALVQLVDAVKGVDMDEVRASMAQQSGSSTE